MSAVDAVLVGAGNRGRSTYGAWARAHPERLRIVAVAEPRLERREAFASEHGLGAGDCFDDWRPLLAAPRRAPVAIVATGDAHHVAPALAALAAGYHLLLEKPIALSAAECVAVVEAAERAGRILQISHVLRYTPFYERVAGLLAGGAIGDLLHLDLREHVAAWHFVHSYVRGKFRRSDEAAPVLLAKACHDLDLLAWFVGAPAARVASFGRLGQFRADAAPPGAPERCSDGCPVQASCAYDAVRFYADPPDELAKLWPWSDVSLDPSREARRHALAAGPYGRCAFRCDNDVLDRQSVLVEFENGVTASFGLHGHAAQERRTLRATGSRGELRGVLQDGVLELSRPGALDAEEIRVPASALDHYGGDPGLLDHFTRVIEAGDAAAVRASGRSALESHLLGFAAEQARREGRVVSLSAFRAGLARQAG